jgi:SNF family Na+-dependent transporter
MTHSNRGTWNNKADFVLALISYGVGLGNVWRFPYLAYSSGGGAFLLPFLISSLVVGIPYALLEVSLGQWMKEGGIGAWNLTPLFKGIGFANLIIVFFGNVYYEVILAWTLRYLYDSFSYDLPWKYCKNNWNTQCCSETLLYGKTNSTVSNRSSQVSTIVDNHSEISNHTCAKLVDPITEYWE